MPSRSELRRVSSLVSSRSHAMVISAATMLLVAGGCKSGGSQRGDMSSAPAQPGDVGGRMLLVLGDADLPAAIPGEALLADRDAGARDALTIVTLPIVEPVTPSTQFDVSNSAFGSPACLAVTPDGRFAYVLESRGPGGEGSARSADSLPMGENLTTIDVSSPMAPVSLGTTYVGTDPRAVAVHPDGDLLAVATRNPRNQIVIMPLNAGIPGAPASWPLLGLDDDQAAPSCIAWHPSGKALAVTLPDRDEVVFYAFSKESDGALAIAAWGGPVKVGRHPVFGAFTPDGRHFMTIDSNHGGDSTSQPASSGQLTLIRVSDNVAATEDSTTAHAVVSHAAVGIGPVGAAFSPDGRLIACGNTQASVSAAPASGTAGGGSISLFTLGSDGSVTAAGEYPVGAVPAGVSFDTRGRFVLVSQYRSPDPEAADGEVSFWKVVSGGGTPSLIQQDFFLGIGAGPHGSIIVR